MSRLSLLLQSVHDGNQVKSISADVAQGCSPEKEVGTLGTQCILLEFLHVLRFRNVTCTTRSSATA